MKKKLIKRSTQKYNDLFSKGRFYIRIVYRDRAASRIRKLKHKYREVLDFENSTLLGNRLISVPVITKAKCKKSRVNHVFSYRIFTSVEEFNTESGLKKCIRDFRPFI